MNGKLILHRFGFELNEEPTSIYAFSPVYRVRIDKQDLIVKRTQRKVDSLLAYTSMLKKQEVNVVTPVPLKAKNPQQIDDTNFIVYPFIEGKLYSGKEEEIYEAGKFLGRIHQLSPNANVYELPEYDVYDFNQEEVEESVSSIDKLAKAEGVLVECELLQGKLLESVQRQSDLQEAGLIHVATPHDYKANNLIYTPEPYLIDPDNATWIPRIFDLALALLLFHNEHKDAPYRTFSPKEWRLFLSGYQTYVTLTDKEKSLWIHALEHVFLDEVMWLMAEVEEDWQNPAQKQLFISLLNLLYDSSGYKLD
ncbi:phosphotransferase [Ornithinibacillus xuwenensis]|uniref:Phosphotransferase n=1 Tax=Ornithinibacillus xuwenensis TaxID=3144668 RepID=A0ABU9XHS8_9BACI